MQLRGCKKQRTGVVMVVSNDSCAVVSTGGGPLEGSPVNRACHSVVVSVGCPDEGLPRHNGR